jgi:NDP-sugar pyrophosphorylase family protein
MKAMIFAAGLGTRFKPWTEKHPKALAPVNGRSLLQHNIQYLQRFGIRDVVVNVHHFSSQIIETINENGGWGSNIMISDEADGVLETGGGLLKARELLGTQTFITINVDILTSLDLGKLILFHQQQEAMITLCIADRDTSRFLLFDEANGLCGWRNIKDDSAVEKIVVPHSNLSKKHTAALLFFSRKY